MVSLVLEMLQQPRQRPRHSIDLWQEVLWGELCRLNSLFAEPTSPVTITIRRPFRPLPSFSHVRRAARSSALRSSLQANCAACCAS